MSITGDVVFPAHAFDAESGARKSMMTRSRVIFADEISWLSCGNSPGLDNHVDDRFRSILSFFLPSLSFFSFQFEEGNRRGGKEMRYIFNKFIISREINDA